MNKEKTKNKKKFIIISVALCVAIAITVSVIIWRNHKFDESHGTAYVSAVSELNTAVSYISSNRFSGVVEAQKTIEVKIDPEKTIKEIMVNEGDSVEVGDKLFEYDVEAMELELEEGQIDVERMQNEIDSMNKQIKELETERKNALADNKISYTTQIQALQTDIDKTNYDIKVKNVSLEKLKNSIKNSAVTTDTAGIVKSLKNKTEMQENGTDVIMTITSNNAFRIKGKINEQNMGAIMQGEPVILHSRIDDSVSWNGTVTEIGNEPEANNNNYGYMEDDGQSMSSNYAFYVEPETTDGLMLGQHLLVELDYGQGNAIEKSGIWLYNDYIVDFDGETPYVWAVGNNDRLEKRYIKIGQTDEDNNDSEIVSGLDDNDLIAYPSDDYVEGMKTSTNIEEDFDGEEYPDDEMNFDGEEYPDGEMNFDGEEYPDGEMNFNGEEYSDNEMNLENENVDEQ